MMIDDDDNDDDDDDGDNYDDNLHISIQKSTNIYESQWPGKKNVNIQYFSSTS